MKNQSHKNGFIKSKSKILAEIFKISLLRVSLRAEVNMSHEYPKNAAPKIL